MKKARLSAQSPTSVLDDESICTNSVSDDAADSGSDAADQPSSSGEAGVVSIKKPVRCMPSYAVALAVVVPAILNLFVVAETLSGSSSEGQG